MHTENNLTEAPMPRQLTPKEIAIRERWNAFGDKTRWLIKRCRDTAFQDFCSSGNAHLSRNKREAASRAALIALFGFEKSRKEVEHPKYESAFNSLKADFEQFLETRKKE